MKASHGLCVAAQISRIVYKKMRALYAASQRCWLYGTLKSHFESEIIMQIRTLFFFIILGAIAALAALNWETFNTPTALWLGVTTVQAPLGLVMLGLTAVLTAFFLAFIIYLQSSVL